MTEAVEPVAIHYAFDTPNPLNRRARRQLRQSHSELARPISCMGPHVRRAERGLLEREKNNLRPASASPT